MLGDSLNERTPVDVHPVGQKKDVSQGGIAERLGHLSPGGVAVGIILEHDVGRLRLGLFEGHGGGHNGVLQHPRVLDFPAGRASYQGRVRVSGPYLGEATLVLHLGGTAKRKNEVGAPLQPVVHERPSVVVPPSPLFEMHGSRSF
jgi:hypothetical protein